jgi:type I restriction enzyme S subunit
MKKGWEIKTLGELVNIKTGKLDSNAMIDGGKYPFFTCSREIFAINDYAFDCEAILLAGNNASGDFNVKHYKGKFNAYQRTYVITVNAENKISYSYLYQQLTNHLKRFKEQSLGANTKFLKIGMIQGMEIPLPPLPEQQRIVAILDEAFAAISKAKSNAEQNLKNAKELFESYLQDVFENKGEGWEEKTFEDVCNLVGGSQPSKDDFIYEPKEGYIRLIQVRDYRTSKYITYIPKDKARRFCSENDIMIGRYGPPIFGIFKGLEGAYNVALMKAEVNTKICNSDYFFWFLKTNKLRVFVENSSKRAAGQDGIRKELLDKYPVPLPKSLKTQQSIVQKLEALSTETKKLEVIYQNKINDLEELKKSVLQKAFSGELKTATALV